jgi:hypothetical protein
MPFYTRNLYSDRGNLQVELVATYLMMWEEQHHVMATDVIRGAMIFYRVPYIPAFFWLFKSPNHGGKD